MRKGETMSDERTIAACVDGSAYAAAACDAAIWAAGKLDAPLAFVNVISRRKHAAATDYSGQIGLGTREHLLTELAELDGQRARLARERGRDFLDSARRRATEAGRPEPTTRQRNGELVDALHSMDDEIRLLAIGKRGESAGDDDHLGSNLERVIRGVSCPILVTNQSFTPPERVLIAFDGSKTGQRVIERAVATPLLAEVEVHLVYVGTPNERAPAPDRCGSENAGERRRAADHGRDRGRRRAGAARLSASARAGSDGDGRLRPHPDPPAAGRQHDD